MRPLAACAITALLMTTWGSSSSAGIYCTAPTAPTMMETKPTPPTEPFCFNKFSGENSCSESDVDFYNSEVATYNAALENYKAAAQEYIVELRQYLAEANQYAKCEVDAL